ncbi:type IV secretory system conjugative DNA transfer family protein [Actinacidiphila acididurans]|uniref:Type VI secretion protein n=1 Tax=Actinacidiphila acididurans TaxID=2784346 RepID=A0ABS2TYK4_9ACTN|nr:type IV secretory system conjugative DNA transfer family protein [Actinacidiphila acididurans]MBM9508419.1 type VI secretion protein [Actinacidiphila acididurans]
MADRKKESGGLPDGLVVGIIGVLLGVTFLAWTGTGIAGLLAHGHWPHDLHFTRTPRALRDLIGDPHDIPAAWPDAEQAALPSSGLFWGVFISQFMVLIVVMVWVINTLARLRYARRRPAGRRAPAPVRAAEADEPGQPLVTGPAPAAGVPTPRRAAAKAGDESLDAWFRTVPQAAPPGATVRDEAPTSVLPAVAPDPTRAASPLADGEVTRTYALFARERGDKAKRVTQPAVLAAAGPVVVTTADPDTYHQTVGNRAKLGPVHVYDPAHLIDVPGRLRWAPHAGCEHPADAAVRARALLAPLRTARADEAIVHDTAVTLLRCWLHAAAVDGRPFRQVQRWAAGSTAAGEAVRILRTHVAAAGGWSGELESVLHAHPDRRDAALALIRHLLEPLNTVHIRDACSPTRAGGLDLESFVAERGTLYVVGERIEDPASRPGTMPLLTSLVSSVVEHGRRMAAGSSAGRLDPPLTFVLDDVAALAPVPDLPALLSGGHAAGLPTLAVLRSPEQALARWHAPLWQDADVRLALGDETADTLPPSVPDAVRIR